MLGGARLLLSLLIAIVSSLLKRFNVRSPYLVFPGMFFNVGRLLSDRSTVGIGFAALCALVMFQLPFSLGWLADLLVDGFSYGFALLEVFLVVTTIHQWSAAAGARVHEQPDSRTLPVVILAISFAQLCCSAYLLVVHVENFAFALSCMLLSVVVVSHNVWHESGVILHATSCVFVACVFLAIGTSTRILAGLVSGQVVTPLLLGAASGYKQRYALFVLLMSVYARTDLRILQAFLVLAGSILVQAIA